jgi:low affinity Fe/Cu permease
MTFLRGTLPAHDESSRSRRSAAGGLGWRACARIPTVPLRVPVPDALPLTTSLRWPTSGSVARRSSFICLVIVLGWLVSLPLWVDAKAWQVAIHTVSSVLTLLLVALLENAGRRSAEAAQEKLNVIAEALAALMASRAVEDRALDEAVTRLRDAVGLEERH